MRQSSAILATPISLPSGGRATTELPGEAPDVELVANYDHHVLEVWQAGKKVAERPFSGVIEMRPAEKGIVCPDCQRTFVDARALGGHRLHAHGVPSSRKVAKL